MKNEPVEILLVEDNAADAELTREGLQQVDIACNLNVVDHGGKAISYLHREGQYSKAMRPDLILLDLDLPQLDGFGVLKHIKSEPSLQDIPVIVLSGHNEPDEIRETYKLQANAYMQKPVCYDDFVAFIQHLTAYWFDVTKLPEPDNDIGPVLCERLGVNLG